MRYLVIIGYLVLGIIPMRAGPLDRIDSNRRADVGDKMIDMSTVHFDSLSQPTRTMPVAPVSSKTADRNQTVEMKHVDFDTLSFATIPRETAPQQNFQAKRAASVDTPTVPIGNAPINQRVIRPLTPAGEKDLKDQINKIP